MFKVFSNKSNYYCYQNKIILLLFLTTIISFSFASADHLYIPIYSPDITWKEANQKAIEQGGHLATIQDEEENNYVFSLIDNDIFWITDGRYGDKSFGPWIGGVRKPGSKSFNWVTGEPFTYSNWYKGEPGEKETYIQYMSSHNKRGNTWNDGDDHGKTYGYILEIDDSNKKSSNFLNLDLSNMDLTLVNIQRMFGLI
jgi:hypothetical protein